MCLNQRPLKKSLSRGIGSNSSFQLLTFSVCRTVGAKAVQFQPVGLDDEAGAGGQLLLQLVEGTGVDLHLPAAPGADQVVTVVLGGQLIQGPAVVQQSTADDQLLFQKGLQNPVNGGEIDGGFCLSDLQKIWSAVRRPPQRRVCRKSAAGEASPSGRRF